MTSVPFPLSSQPGFKPQDGIGRLINVYAFKDAGVDKWRSVPGCSSVVELPLYDEWRGFLDVNGVLYVVLDDRVYTVVGTTVTQLIGVVGGSGPVTMARNNKAPVPDVVMVADSVPYQITTTQVIAYPDPNAGSPNSVSFLDGYNLFTNLAGQIIASDLNDTAIDPLSFATAEAKPDGLLRGIVKGRAFLAMGPASVEFWINAGDSPFPLSRDNVVSVGLISPWAVAGYEDGWEHPIIFVASDNTVRRFDGYAPTRISFPYLERLIEAVADKSTLRACVHTFGGMAIWSLSSPTWTWQYNQATGGWHQRESYGLNRWRVAGTVRSNNRWLAADTRSRNLLVIRESDRFEVDQPITSLVESANITNFPARSKIAQVDFVFNVGVGQETGIEPTQTEPHCWVSWSNDGGSIWGTPLMRKLGRQGQYGRKVSVSGVGHAGRNGRRYRVQWSDPVDVTFMGADQQIGALA